MGSGEIKIFNMRLDMSITGGDGAKRVSVAVEIMNRIDCLASRSEDIGGRCREQLRPICIDSKTVETVTGEITSREYPPFFQEIDDKMDRIESSLDVIASILDRCEV